MKLPLLATRVGILAVKLSVAVLVALSILPLLMGGIGIGLEDEEEGEWTLDGSTIRLEAPLMVSNDGFFDVTDLRVGFTFKDRDGNVLAVSEMDPVDIPAGRETAVPIEIALDLYDLDRQTRSDLIFNGTDMAFDLSVQAKYTWNLVGMSVDGGSEMGWDALLGDLQVRSDMAYLREMDGNHTVVVPFTLYANDMVRDGQALALTEYWDSQGYYANVTQMVDLSDNIWEEAAVPLSSEAYDRVMTGEEQLTVRVTLFFLDCSNYEETTFTEQWGWGG
ncbi:MAG TPA: hypothetical protein PKO24_06360 [Methanomassiliicoccales archaeon]|jgi:hypothetical protein|nr:hypothetical protein [Methanomassiliicoccales archaeon]HQM67435.1 hypothetical protein [Methanomassiliicoccales archaeon]